MDPLMSLSEAHQSKETEVESLKTQVESELLLVSWLSPNTGSVYMHLTLLRSH